MVKNKLSRNCRNSSLQLKMIERSERLFHDAVSCELKLYSLAVAIEWSAELPLLPIKSKIMIMELYVNISLDTRVS